MAFVTPVVEHWLEWEIAQWEHHGGRPIAPWADALPWSNISLHKEESIQRSTAPRTDGLSLNYILLPSILCCMEMPSTQLTWQPETNKNINRKGHTGNHK